MTSKFRLPRLRYACYLAYLNLGCLESGCIDGFGVVVVFVVIVKDVYSDEVVVVRIFGNPCYTETCCTHFMNKDLNGATRNAFTMMLI